MRTVIVAVSLCLLAILLATPVIGGTLKISVDDPYVKPGEQVYASIIQTGLDQPVSGVQAFITYSSDLISIAPSNITVLSEPFGLTIRKEVSDTYIDLALGTDIFAGQGPGSANAELARLAFTAGPTQGTAAVKFRTHIPSSTFTDPDGNAVAPQLIDSPPVVIDGVPPVITTSPSDITVPNDPGLWSARVEVGSPVAVDELSGVSEIIGVRSDGKPLDALYPVGLTTIHWTVYDRSGNTAGCTQRVVVYAVGILEPVIPDPYVKPGEAVYASLKQSSLFQPVTGFQAFLSFDPGMMSITKPDITFTPVPYGLPIYKAVNGAGIDLAAGINVFIGQNPTWDDAILAVMKFSAGHTEGITHVSFRSVVPPSRFTDLAGDSIYPALRDSDDIIIDGTAPCFTAPADVYVTALEGAANASVYLAVPTATDELSGMASVVGTRSDELALDAPYPIGATAVTWTATDRSGNSYSHKQLIVVAPYGFNGVLARSVGEAKQLADGSQVALVTPVCTRLFGTYFYVEDSNRAAGIKIDRATGIPVVAGLLPAVFGTIRTVQGERAINESRVAPYTTGTVPLALGSNCRALESSLIQGMLVELWGHAEVPTGAVTVFTLNDGSPSPVRIRAAGLSLPADGAYVTVTGVVGFEYGNPVLRVDNARDIVTINQH